MMVWDDIHENGPEAKRRKVRKGTQSCWECKRRKVRCISSSVIATCDNCRRRGTTCISQEYPDRPSLSTDGDLGARLGRVEHLLEQLLSNPGAVPLARRAAHHNSESPRRGSDTLTGDPRALSVSTTVAPVPQIQGRQATCKYEALTRELISAWPSQADIDIICTLPVGFSTHAHCGICIPSSISISRNPSSPRDMLRLPPPDSHPVLFARRLLLLGTFLQGVPPVAMKKLGSLSTSYLEIMANSVEKAVRLVTTNDSLTGSVEGLECIMIEAKYHNYAGQMQNSYMAARRAISVAQMMAIHRGFKSPSLKFLESETRKVFNPDQIMFKLAEMDSYLAMMLNMAPSPIEITFANDKALEDCHPIDRMERIFFISGRRLLERNTAGVDDLEATWDIDKTLQKAVNEITKTDPQWWLDPNSSHVPGTEKDESTILSESIRTTDQLIFYHLLIRLHLPYMLRPSSDPKFMSNKLTLVHASRETLTRYNSFRIYNPAEYYCRGSDYLALVALTTLCLAYISSASQAADQETIFPDAYVQFLTHNRPSARAIMEQTLQIVESLSKNTADSINSDISRAMRSLLTTESNAANGVVYQTSSSTGEAGAFTQSSRTTEGNKALQIHLPHFGTIHFKHGMASRSTPTSEGLSAEGPSCANHSTPGTSNSVHGVFHQQDLSERQHLRAAAQYDTAASGIGNIQQLNTDLLDTTILPEFPGLGDDWGDLQGVDLALFDSIFRGMDDADVSQNIWPQWMEAESAT